MTFEAPEENAPLTEYGKEVKHGSAYPGVMALYYLETAGHSLNTTKDNRYKRTRDTTEYQFSSEFTLAPTSPYPPSFLSSSLSSPPPDNKIDFRHQDENPERLLKPLGPHNDVVDGDVDQLHKEANEALKHINKSHLEIGNRKRSKDTRSTLP